MPRDVNKGINTAIQQTCLWLGGAIGRVLITACSFVFSFLKRMLDSFLLKKS